MKEFGRSDRDFDKRDRADRDRVDREQRERLERDRLEGGGDLDEGADLYDADSADRSLLGGESSTLSSYDDRSERDSLYGDEGAEPYDGERDNVYSGGSPRGETLSAGGATSAAGSAPGGSVMEDSMPIFPAEDTERFRSRWMEIQTHFVDEPRRSVEEADELVEEVTERLTSVFSRSREELERQWTAGDEVSTEDLRRTLQRYRVFFQQLLSV